jgi:hypothetical protein
LPAFVLIVFITAEAFLKVYAPEIYFPFAIGLLVLCLSYFLYYFRRNPSGKNVWESFFESSPISKWNSLILLAILLIAGFLRFWKLGSLFDGMTFDEAYKGLDGIAINQFGERPIFLDWNGGREALIAYLVAFNQHFLDYTSVSVRLINAVSGCV